MGLWRYLFDTDWRQREDIDSAHEIIGATSSEAEQSREIASQLEPACGVCGKPITRRRSACVYCGAPAARARPTRR